jgi:hypothetical protein
VHVHATADQVQTLAHADKAQGSSTDRGGPVVLLEPVTVIAHEQSNTVRFEVHPHGDPARPGVNLGIRNRLLRDPEQG